MQPALGTSSRAAACLYCSCRFNGAFRRWLPPTAYQKTIALPSLVLTVAMKRPRKQSGEPVSWPEYVIRAKPQWVGSVEARDAEEVRRQSSGSLSGQRINCGSLSSGVSLSHDSPCLYSRSEALTCRVRRLNLSAQHS